MDFLQEGAYNTSDNFYFFNHFNLFNMDWTLKIYPTEKLVLSITVNSIARTEMYRKWWTGIDPEVELNLSFFIMFHNFPILFKFSWPWLVKFFTIPSKSPVASQSIKNYSITVNSQACRRSITPVWCTGVLHEIFKKKYLIDLRYQRFPVYKELEGFTILRISTSMGKLDLGHLSKMQNGTN